MTGGWAGNAGGTSPWFLTGEICPQFWDILALVVFPVRMVLLCGWFTDVRVARTAPSGRMFPASNAKASLLDILMANLTQIELK